MTSLLLEHARIGDPVRVTTPIVLVDPDIPADWLPSPRGLEWRSGTLADSIVGAHRVAGALTTLNQRVGLADLNRWLGLKVISNVAVGLDNIDLVACRDRGVLVGHTPGVLTDATADLTVALLLALARQLVAAADDAKAGRWQRWSMTGWLGRELAGQRLGIVGMGAIGRAVAHRAAAFGMAIQYCGRPAAGPLGQRERPSRSTVEPALVSSDGRDRDQLFERVTLEELVKNSDVISLHCPLTSETRGMISTRLLRSMKPTALLINTSRGAVIDQDALLEALSLGLIAGAALDVTTPEPLAETHPLFALPNCLITPHIGSAAVETRQRMTNLACANLFAALDGGTMPHRAVL